MECEFSNCDFNENGECIDLDKSLTQSCSEYRLAIRHDVFCFERESVCMLACHFSFGFIFRRLSQNF